MTHKNTINERLKLLNITLPLLCLYFELLVKRLIGHKQSENCFKCQNQIIFLSSI